jgi:AAA ATPase domain
MPEKSPEVFSSGERPLLFDREDDLAALDAALTDAAAGTRGVLLIEGPAGIGKTVLLDGLRRRADATNMTVLSARGGELERGFGFGIVRQLLEAAVLGADAAERDRVVGGRGPAGRAGVHRCLGGRGHR